MTIPTIVDVAERAGVSKSLVSLVMRDAPGVSPQRRRAVLDAAAALGYRPNTFARSLAERRTGLLGVVLTDLHNPYHTEVVDGVEAGADDAGYRILLGHGRRQTQRLGDLVDDLLGMRVEGLVIVSSWVEPQLLERIATDVPTVVVGRPETVPGGVDLVANNDRRGAELAVEHLVRLGHRDIAYLGTDDRPAARERRHGYEDAMAGTGLAGYIRTVPSETTRDGGERAAQTLLEGVSVAGGPAAGEQPAGGAPAPVTADLPGAVIAVNDLAAIGLIQRLDSAGVPVPEAVSVVGYDSSALGEFTRPRLTSVNQPRREMGRIAVSLLESRRKEPGRADEHVVLTPELHIRDSTAPR